MAKASKSKLVATVGVFAALTTVATVIVQIPVPETKGYINLGDAVVLLSGIVLGPAAGALAGGIGSALADVLSGYAHWAPFTLVIKGVEGFLAGLLSRTGKKALRTLGVLLAAFEMVLGYFLVETLLYGVGAALAELPGNVFQAVFGALVALLAGEQLRRRIGVADAVS